MDHFIDGIYDPPASGAYLPVLNPCTGETVGTCPAGTPEDVDVAVKSAAAAFRSWKRRPLAERVRLQHAAAALMRDRADMLAGVLTSELGRPLAGCLTEIHRSAELLDFYAEEALRMSDEMLAHGVEGEKVLVTRQPVGVVAAITPFNYPITLLTFKLGAALPVGCTVVAKPSEDTPLSTLHLAAIFTEAGFPPGVFNVVTGLGAVIGDALVAHPLVSKVAFTGGTRTGEHIAALAVSRHKRLILELGGQSPAIVCADADLDTAIPALVRHAFANSGQFCYRVNRIYVHTSIADAFLARFTEGARRLKTGHTGKDPSCDLGPLVNEKIFRNSEVQVADALAQGASIRTGGERLRGGDYETGWYFPPTVVADATPGMKIMREETFGPVVGVAAFADTETAIEAANDSPYGLAAYVFSRDLGAAWRVADALEAGSVWVNNIHRSYHNAPFGGMKASGTGREKGRWGLESYTELKTTYLSF